MKQLLVLLMLLCSANIFAQDVIVKKDGSTILSKVIEIGTSEVKYKKYSNQNGPTYTIEISAIQAINYNNGEKDDFSNSKNEISEQREHSSHSSNKIFKKPADSRNIELINLYNRNYNLTEKTMKNEGKIGKYKGKRVLLVSNTTPYIFGVNTNSIMSNEDIEMLFVREERHNPNGYDECIYNIRLKNKTNKTIYIDKGNCFRIENNGDFYCYFDASEQFSVSQGNEYGGSLGLGSVAGVLGINGKIGQLASGVNVGGGSNRNVTRNYSQQRVIAIPPQGVRNLCIPNFVKTKGYRVFGDQHSVHETVEDAEVFHRIQKPLTHGDTGVNYVNYGKVTYYDENKSPYKRKYIITYSTEENFNTYSTIETELFVRMAIGCDASDSFMYYGLKPEKYIENVNEYTIYGCCRY